MRDAKMMVCLRALAACVGAPSLSVAEDNCSGYWVQVGTTQVSLDNDPSSPQHLAIGTCQDGRSCTFKDRDYDSWTNQSENPGGAGKGTWKTVSGTGKYQSATSSGWWETTLVDVGPEGAIYVGTWGGTCKRD